MIYLLYGEEYFLLKSKEDEIIKSSKIDNIISIDFSSSKLSDVLNEVYYCDLFNSKKLIIVSNFSFKSLNKDEEESFKKYLDNMNDNIVILKSIDASIDSKKTIIKKLNKVGNVYNAKKLDKYELTSYLIELFKKEKYKISDTLIKKVIDICSYSKYSNDNSYIFNEINKLMMYKYDTKEITSEDVEAVISKNMDNEMYNLVNAVLCKDTKNIFDEFKIIKELEVDPYFILSSISKQFRTLTQIKILSSGMAGDAIAKKLGMNPYAIQIIGKNTRLYSIDDLANILEKIFYTDEKMKSENIDKYRILEEFFIELE